MTDTIESVTNPLPPVALCESRPKSGSLEENAGWFSRLCFSWMNGLLWRAGRGTLAPSSLLDLPSGTDSASLDTLLQSHLDKSGATTMSARALACLMFRVFRRTLLLNMITRFIADACAVGQPILLSFLIRAIAHRKRANEGEDPVTLILVLVMTVLLVLQTFATKMHTQSMATLGLKVKVGLNALIYRKALATGGGETLDPEPALPTPTLAHGQRAQANSGQPSGSMTSSQAAEAGSHDASGTGRIVNLLSADTRRIESFITILHFTWSGLLQTVAVIVLLIHDLGAYSALAGLALIVVSLPFQYWVMHSSSRARALASHYSDLRVKTIRESFTFIRLLKTYCWEPVWASLIKADRAQELKYIERMNLGRVYLAFSSFSMPILASIAALMTWVWRHPETQLTSDIVFPTLSLFALLRIPLTNYPYIVMMIIDAQVAFQRIAKLWNQAEKKNIRKIDTTQTDAIVQRSNGQEIVIEKGKLTVIVGAVGSGKTRLLHALFGDQEADESDSISLPAELTLSSDHVVFSPRQCWLQNCAIKDNILFGRPYDPLRYAAVLEACELSQGPSDEFPYGDATVAGEGGSCLSAGQRARVCLARSVYIRPDILLLDDPMAAVDGAVGHRIHCNLFKGELLVQHGVRATVVMTTHQMKWLSLSDVIIVLDQGAVVAQGPWSLLKTNPILKKLFGSHLATGEASSAWQPHISTAATVEPTSPTLSHVQPMSNLPTTAPDTTTLPFDRPLTPTELAPGLELATMDIIQPPVLEGTEEERLYGPVALSIYSKYVKLAGGWVLFFLLGCLSIAAIQVCRLATDLWITMWVAHGRTNAAFRNLTEGQMQAIYIVLGCSQLLVGGLSALVFVYCGIVAARKCHATALASVLKAPMSFFDSNPIGRLLNRFSRDIDAIDTCLMDSFRQVLMKGAFVVCTVIMIAILVPILLAPLVTLVFVYYGLQYFYRPACRELSRIASVLRSPYYAHVNESLSSGLLTVQSYPHCQALFLRKGYQVLDESQRPIYALYSAKNWADLRIEMVGHVSFLIAALICLYTHLSSSMVGLVMNYSRNFSMAIYWFIYSWIDLEIYANSLERLFHYSNQSFECEKDADDKIGKLADSSSSNSNSSPSLSLVVEKSAWLTKKENLLLHSAARDPGPILEFDHVSLCYRVGLPKVLSSISFKVAAGEKIGIVGRTGAGKSTILLALFRLIDPSEGVIRLHGENIQSMGLKALRRKMAMVPQEPVIFAGSIRFNLDPSGSYPEYDLWCALEKAHMRKYVQTLPERLDTVLASNDPRLSIGQRQLICLARALLLNTSLLLFDETSAHMDYETDVLLQSTLHSPEFSHITVLTIAHRLSSLKHYDRILYLADGKIVRMDTPRNIFDQFQHQEPKHRAEARDERDQ